MGLFIQWLAQIYANLFENAFVSCWVWALGLVSMVDSVFVKRNCTNRLVFLFISVSKVLKAELNTVFIHCNSLFKNMERRWNNVKLRKDLWKSLTELFSWAWNNISSLIQLCFRLLWLKLSLRLIVCASPGALFWFNGSLILV